MKKLLSHATIASTALAAGIARASESPDTGVTEMNAGFGTVGLLIGGVAVMGVFIWLLMKFMGRKQ